ncbi:MAG: hypothetical protein HZA52_17245, partial [Planctomycetes bacterium]|nr:hypothetical protein [Planctomycetota bacterium]
ISRDIFWNLGKILLALCLLWFYFWWADFLTFWYGRLPNEENILQLLMFGPYRTAFILSFILNFLFESPGVGTFVDPVTGIRFRSTPPSVRNARAQLSG